MFRCVTVVLLASLLCRVDSQEYVPVVQNLTAKVLGETSIKVEWSAPAEGADEYKVSAVAIHAPPAVVVTKDTSVTFIHLVPQKEYSIKVAVMHGQTAYARYAEVNATTIVIDPAVGDLQANFVNDTSLKVTWRTAHAGEIHISVCPVAPSEKNCTSYTTNGDSLEYQIDVVGHDTTYEVRAKFSTLAGDIPCYHEESSVTVKRPAAGGHNSGSSNEVCGLLTLALLLLPLMKSS